MCVYIYMCVCVLKSTRKTKPKDSVCDAATRRHTDVINVGGERGVCVGAGRGSPAGKAGTTRTSVTTIRETRGHTLHRGGAAARPTPPPPPHRAGRGKGPAPPPTHDTARPT